MATHTPLTLSITLAAILVLLAAPSFSQHSCLNPICSDSLFPHKNSQKPVFLNFLKAFKNMSCDISPQQLGFLLEIYENILAGHQSNAYDELQEIVFPKISELSNNYHEVLSNFSRKLSKVDEHKYDFSKQFKSDF